MSYRVRLFAVKHSRFFERLYHSVNPAIVGTLRGVNKVFGKKLDRPITAMESGLKGFLFDCKMCGNCALSKTGMSCPMNCPKTIRNGPCGGVRADGMCEVKPEMKCVWVQAWDGAARMKFGDDIKDIEFAIDHRDQGKSTWLRIARGEIAEKVSDRH
ncbi:MAG: hypothetical protein HKN36_07640 [Hellea sp.]|nr:hypothetical protein [Hellea sp.]